MNEISRIILNGIFLIGVQAEDWGAVVVRPEGQEVEGDLLAGGHRQSSQQSQSDFVDLLENVVHYSDRLQL